MKLCRASSIEEFQCTFRKEHPAPMILELHASASTEGHLPTFMEENPTPVTAPSMEELTAAAASVEELPAAASMEVQRSTLMEENPAPVTAASMEELPAAAASIEELHAAASMEVHCSTLMEENPAPVTAASMEEPPAASMDAHPPSSLEELPAAVAHPAAPMVPVDVDDENYLSSFPTGYRFDPYDHELIIYYLKPKIAGEKLPPSRIHEVNLYQYSPHQLVEKYQPAKEGQWYFFTPRDKKYKGGERPNRSAGDGYWRASGADTAVMHGGERVASLKRLVFYKGEHKLGVQTEWNMHEYVVPDRTPKMEKSVASSDMKLDDWVLCRIYKNKSRKGSSTRHRYKGSAPDNPLAAVQEANGEGSPNSPMEVQSSSGQGTISLTEGQSNVQQDNSALIEVQSHSGQRDNGPIQRQNIFVQASRSPVGVQRKGKGILMKGGSHGQRDNGPMKGQNAFMQGIRSYMKGQRRGKGIIIEDQNHDGEKDNGPMDGQNVFIQGINGPMAGQGNVGQGNGILMEIQSHGRQRVNGPRQGQNVFIQGISSPMAGQNSVGQGNGLLIEVQNHGGQRDNGPMEGQNIVYQGLGRPVAGQWQETIMNPNYYEQVNYLDYPFNKLAPQLTTNHQQTLPSYPNPLISHLHTQQIHGNNDLSYFNQAHQNPQFAQQVLHQYGNQVLNWQAESHNISEFNASQIHQRQQLVSNDLNQQFHLNNSNYDMIPYRLLQNDTNEILLEPSGNFGEFEDLQCNYMLDNTFFDQLISYGEIYGGNGSDNNNNGDGNHNSNNNKDEAQL